MEAAYKIMYEALRKRIARKEYAIGELLPTESELEKEFQVSRTTVRRAVELLVQEGYVVKKQGCGTRVVSRKAIQNLNKLTSISDSLERKGHEIGIKSCYVEVIPADEEKANALAVAEGTPLVWVQRIRTADGVPVGIMKNYIIASYVLGLEDCDDINRLYVFLEEKYGICYTDSHDVISACNASYEESQLLGIPPKTALIAVQRICSIKNRPIELDEVCLIASGYEFEVFCESSEKYE